MSEQAASTTQTGQQSSGQQNQSASGGQGQNDGSSLTPATPPARPEYVPEAYWDATANKVKDTEFTAHIGQLAATQAAHDERLKARPDKPEGYELKFGEGYKPDVAVKFDETDVRVAPLRAFAHKHNWSQAEFSEALQIEAANVAAEQKIIADAQAAEIGKLGANGPARVTASRTWLTGILGDKAAAAVMDRMVLASDIEALEKLQLAFTNQGGSTYSNGGREPPAPPKASIEDRWYGNGKAS